MMLSVVDISQLKPVISKSRTAPRADEKMSDAD
jgi:hypothetical protein